MEDLQPYDTLCRLANVRPTKDRNKCNGNEFKQDINTWQITEVSDSTKQHADDGVRSPQSAVYVLYWPWKSIQTMTVPLVYMRDEVLLCSLGNGWQSDFFMVIDSSSLKHYAFDQKYFFRKLENFPEGPTGSLAKIISLITYYTDDWSLLKQLWD